MNNRELFQSQGYLVLENFNTAEVCDSLIQQGELLANNFNFEGHPSVFQTTEQAKTTDDYFLNSGDIVIPDVFSKLRGVNNIFDYDVLYLD